MSDQVESLPVMTLELKDKWLEALRSGKYKQGRSALCHVKTEEGERSHCCIGVLADIIDPDGWKEPRWVNESDFVPHYRMWGKEDAMGNLPAKVYQSLGLTRLVNHEERGEVVSCPIHQLLVTTNDRSHDFDAVIPLIEKHVKPNG